MTIVPFIVDIFNFKKEPKNYTKSLNKFTIRTRKSMIILGMIAFIFTTVILVGVLHQEEGEFPPVGIVMFGFLYSLALFSFLYPAPRFWDIVVDGDKITVIKCFIFIKKTAFSEIVKVEIANNNYIKVYKNEMKRAFFLIDPSMNGKNNFLKEVRRKTFSLSITEI